MKATLTTGMMRDLDLGRSRSSSPTTISKVTFLKLPTELIECIILHLIAQNPFDVFVVYSPTLTSSQRIPLLRPLRQTCRLLSSIVTSTTFKAKAFPLLFDVGAVERRNFTPSDSMKSDQWDVWGWVIAWVGKRDTHAGTSYGDERGGESGWDDEESFTLLTRHPENIAEIFLQAYLMLVCDDGKNRAQLEHAGLYPLLKQYLLDQHPSQHRRQRPQQPHLYSHTWNAWPIESLENSCCLWLLWMLTTEERLRSEGEEEKERIIDMMAPWVLVPFRYSASHAPAPHFSLPLSPTLFVPTQTGGRRTQTQRARRAIPSYNHPHSVATAHGPYPIYERSYPQVGAVLSITADSGLTSTTMTTSTTTSLDPPRTFSPSLSDTISIPFFSGHHPLSVPPPSLAAILLYFSRRELAPFGIPPHLAPTRNVADQVFRDSVIRGMQERGEDFDRAEVDTMRRPVGPTKEDMAEFNGFKGSQLPFETSWYDGWEGWKGEAGESTLDGVTKWNKSPGISGPWDPDWLNHSDVPTGKLPHIPAPSSKQFTTWHESIPPSIRYDNDYFRSRYCYDPFLVHGRRNGDVYTPGLVDGLWQGRMLIPSEGPFLNLIRTPDRPVNFGEQTFFTITIPVFMRLKEWHWVRGSQTRGDMLKKRGPHRLIEVEDDSDGSTTPTAGSSTSRGTKLVPWHQATIPQRMRELRREEEPLQGGPIPAAPRRDRIDEAMNNAWIPEGCAFEERHDRLEATLPHLPSRDVPPSMYERYRRGQPNSHDSEYCLECCKRISEAELLRNVGRVEGEEEVLTRANTMDEGKGKGKRAYEDDEEGLGSGTHTDTTDNELLRTRFGGSSGYEKIWRDIGLGRAMKRRKGESAGLECRSRSDVDQDYVRQYAPAAEEVAPVTDADDAGDDEADWMDVDDDDPDNAPGEDDLNDDGASEVSEEAFSDNPQICPPCNGISDIIITGSTDPSHSAAWHSFLFRGRVRHWDGLVAILRVSRDPRMGDLIFTGYIVGGRNFVGRWRSVGIEGAGRPAWEGAFSMSRRE